MTEEEKNDNSRNTNSDNSEDLPTESEEQIEKPQILFALSKDVQDYVETELGMVKFLDFLIEQKFDIAFNKIDMYQDRFFDIFIKENDRLSDEFDRLEIEDAVNTIKDTTEEIAVENGINNSLQKRMNKINYILMGALFGTMIILSVMGRQDITNVIMIPMFIVLCFVPQVIRKKMTNSWNDFKTAFNDELEARIGDKIANVKLFSKFALNDCRDFMLENKFPLQLLKFDLYSKDYMGVKVIDEKIQSGRKVYFLQFEYPEGIEPFPTPTKVLQSGIATMQRTTSQIEDGEDLFVIFPDAIFSENKLVIDNQQIAEDSQQKEIETLLDSSEFEKVSDPENIIENFKTNQKILCECDNPLKLNDMQKITTEIGFEFYLGIASKCSGCGKNPFVLFSKEGNEIPDDLQGIF